MEHDLVLIENHNNKFDSAAKALNYGAKKAKSDLLMFVHQDIRWKETNTLSNLLHNCQILEQGDIAGVAGAVVKNGRKKTLTNITHSDKEIVYPSAGFKGESIGVESIDECVIIMLKATWISHPFDEELCDNWHCYGVEQCLYARKNGNKVYAFNAEINHLSSTGSLNYEFYRAIIRLIKKYRNDFSYIVATTGYWPVKRYYYYILRRILSEKKAKFMQSRKLKRIRKDL